MIKKIIEKIREIAERSVGLLILLGFIWFILSRPSHNYIDPIEQFIHDKCGSEAVVGYKEILKQQALDEYNETRTCRGPEC